MDPKYRAAIGGRVIKYKLETIPVWDALQENNECLLCTLMEKAENRYIDYYLGSSVMNPETRVQVNTTGFCHTHYQVLTKAVKPQALGLIANTHLQETSRQLEPEIQRLKKAGSAKKARTSISKIAQLLKARETGCLICSSMDTAFNRYAYTLAYLWGSDQEFRAAYAKTRGICLHHFPLLMDIAEKALQKQTLLDFYQNITEQMEKHLSAALEEVHWMTQMFKSENRDKDWRGCQDAHERAIHLETGRGRRKQEV